MKRGNIEADAAEGALLTCNFHNSKFSCKTGKCTQWVTGALGFQNDLVAGIMGNVGQQKTDIKAYSVKDNGDGTVAVAF